MYSSSNSLAIRLNGRRGQTFVGRTQELARIREALHGSPGAPVVFYLHGPGGIGKTTLMRRLADEAGRAERLIVEVDGRLIDPSPAGFEREAAKAHSNDNIVLLVDSFDHCQGLEGWLRDRFLPELSEKAVVIISGRQPPSTAWTHDLAWRGVLEVFALGPLDREDAALFLERRGVPASKRAAVHAFAGGHPLALSLAASVALEGTGIDEVFDPQPDVIATLLSVIVGDLPSPTHRLALETAAHVLTTTEGILRAVIGEHQAAPIFEWLRRLPFAEHGRNGLHLHDLVSEALDRDLRWRDPQAYEHMHRSTGQYLLNQVRTAPAQEVMSSVRALTYLKRYGPMAPYFQSLQREGDVYETPLQPADHETVLHMAENTEGEKSVEAVRFWLEHQPSAFWIYREARTGRPVAFFTWLKLTRLMGREADPLVARAWDAANRISPLTPGEQVFICRFMVNPEAYDQVSTVAHLMQLRICGDWIRSPNLAWSFIVSSAPELWQTLMEHLGHRELCRQPWSNGLTFTVYGCDWRFTPLEIWFDQTQPGQLYELRQAPAPDEATSALATREEFDGAVRDALRKLHRIDGLRGHPLLSSRMIMAQSGTGDTDPVERLHQILLRGIKALLDDPRAAKAHRALEGTYVRRVPSQEAAAEILGLPYSTYRRHLNQGLDRLCDLLWQLEISSATGGWTPT